MNGTQKMSTAGIVPANKVNEAAPISMAPDETAPGTSWSL